MSKTYSNQSITIDNLLIKLITIDRFNFGESYKISDDFIDDSINKIIVKTEKSLRIDIEYSLNKKIRYNSVGLKLYSTNNYISLELLSSNYLNKFLYIVYDFIVNNDKKDAEQKYSNIDLWWEEWENILGNTLKKKKIYDVIAEMYVCQKLNQISNLDVSWDGLELKTSIDFSSEQIDFEVKSTVIKSSNFVTISSLNQLKYENKTLYLIFIKLERCSNGITIDSMSESLKKLGFNYENILENAGYFIGSKERKVGFKILESRIYEVNDSFPTITKDKLMNVNMIEYIQDISYRISLDGLEYKKFDDFIENTKI